MTDPYAWLDPAPVAEKPARAVDKVRKPKAQAVVRTTKREELVALLNQLTFEQRIWLRALAENGFNSMKARKHLKAANLPVPASYKISRWASGNPAFVPAREMVATMLYEAQMPSRDGLLVRINDIAEYCAETEDEIDDEGKPTGRSKMRDVGNALRANEMIGKSMKVFGDEAKGVAEGPQLIVQIISGADHSKVIDVTPGKVQIAPSRVEPGEVIDAEPANGET